MAFFKLYKLKFSNQADYEFQKLYETSFTRAVKSFCKIHKIPYDNWAKMNIKCERVFKQGDKKDK